MHHRMQSLAIALVASVALLAGAAAADEKKKATPVPTFGGQAEYPLLDCTACNALGDILEKALAPLMSQVKDLDGEGLFLPMCEELYKNCKLIQMPNKLRSWYCGPADQLKAKPAAVAYTAEERELFSTSREKLRDWCQAVAAERPKLVDWVVTKAKKGDEGIPKRLCIKGLKFCLPEKMPGWIQDDHNRFAAYENRQRIDAASLYELPADDPALRRAAEFQFEVDDDSDLLPPTATVVSPRAEAQ